MNFDNFKIVEKTYKNLAAGRYDRVQVEKSYKLLPEEYKVVKSTKNERMAAIKVWYEKVFLEAIEKLLPNGNETKEKSE